MSVFLMLFPKKKEKKFLMLIPFGLNIRLLQGMMTHKLGGESTTLDYSFSDIQEPSKEEEVGIIVSNLQRIVETMQRGCCLLASKHKILDLHLSLVPFLMMTFRNQPRKKVVNKFLKYLVLRLLMILKKLWKHLVMRWLVLVKMWPIFI